MKKKLIPLLCCFFLLGGCNNPAPSVDPEPTPTPPPAPSVALTSISLSGTYQTTFTVNDSFTYEGLVVTAHYSDKSSNIVTDYTVTPPDMSVVGSTYAYVSYTEGTITKETLYEVVIEDVVPEAYSSVFSEPLISRQTYLNHIGDIYSVWKDYRGKGVTVAVIDSEFDTTHEDLKRKDGTSKISSLSAAFKQSAGTVSTEVGIDKVHGTSDSHGTFCAGIVGAAQNDKGTIGIAPEADLMLLKVDKTPKSIAAAFKYAADNGVKVITISLGSYWNYDGDLVDDGSDLAEVFVEPLTYCKNKGVIVCSAAGNGGLDSQPTEYTWPAATDAESDTTLVIGCGGLAFNEDDRIWEGTSYNSGPSWQFADVFAPSDMMFGICNYTDHGQHMTYDSGWRGTSFASPIVAGMAALYLEKYPTHTAAEFVPALYASCKSMPAHSMKDVNLNMDNFGYGHVDVGALLGISSPTGEVIVKVKDSESSMNIYAWGDNEELAAWPGKSMSKNGDIFSYTLDISKYTNVIFNSNGAQTINISLSSFLDGNTYDVSNAVSENGFYIGYYI